MVIVVKKDEEEKKEEDYKKYISFYKDYKNYLYEQTLEYKITVLKNAFKELMYVVIYNPFRNFIIKINDMLENMHKK